MKQTVQQLFDYYLSYMPLAGAYALEIQSRIEKHPDKQGMDNPFGAALTDADLSLQNFFEVITLARFPGVAFFGEEEEQSLNMKYFPEGVELKVLLDPIDGTRYYADNLPSFNIIVSIVSQKGFEAAIVYIPGKERCYAARSGEGARVYTRVDLLEGRAGGVLELSLGPPP